MKTKKKKVKKQKNVDDKREATPAVKKRKKKIWRTRKKKKKKYRHKNLPLTSFSRMMDRLFPPWASSSSSPSSYFQGDAYVEFPARFFFEAFSLCSSCAAPVSSQVRERKKETHVRAYVCDEVCSGRDKKGGQRTRLCASEQANPSSSSSYSYVRIGAFATLLSFILGTSRVLLRTKNAYHVSFSFLVLPSVFRKWHRPRLPLTEADFHFFLRAFLIKARYLKIGRKLFGLQGRPVRQSWAMRGEGNGTAAN